MSCEHDKGPRVIEFYKFKILWVILFFLVSWLFFTAFPVSCDFKVPTSVASTSALPEKGTPGGATGGVYNPGIPDAVRNAPASDEQLFFDDGVKEVCLDIPVGSWSAEVITPQSSKDYRLNVKPDKTVFYVKFADGHIEKVGGGEKRFKDVKIRRGVMRIYGTVPGQKATVEVD